MNAGILAQTVILENEDRKVLRAGQELMVDQVVRAFVGAKVTMVKRAPMESRAPRVKTERMVSRVNAVNRAILDKMVLTVDQARISRENLVKLDLRESVVLKVFQVSQVLLVCRVLSASRVFLLGLELKPSVVQSGLVGR